MVKFQEKPAAHSGLPDVSRDLLHSSPLDPPGLATVCGDSLLTELKNRIANVTILDFQDKAIMGEKAMREHGALTFWGDSYVNMYRG